MQASEKKGQESKIYVDFLLHNPPQPEQQPNSK